MAEQCAASDAVGDTVAGIPGQRGGEDAVEWLPPVRLPDTDELSAEVSRIALLDDALRLARWFGKGRPIAADGELPDELADAAVAELGLTPQPGSPAEEDAQGDPRGDLDLLWLVVQELGLVEVAGDSAAAAGAAARDRGPAAEERVALWVAAARYLVELHIGGLVAALDRSEGLGASFAAEAAGGGLAEEIGALLAEAVATLHTYRVLREGRGLDPFLAAPPWPEPEAGMMPLPVLAGTSAAPYGAEPAGEPDTEEGAAAMTVLDPLMRIMDRLGIVDYRRPAAPGAVPDEPADEDAYLSRLGMVRLTALGGYAVKQLDLLPGAPVLGEFTDRPAQVLLDAVVHYPVPFAEEEARRWITARPADAAARELLDAARDSAGPGGPLRRLALLQALPLFGDGGPGGEPERALRGVLADGELGGLARVHLVERMGRGDVPPADEEMAVWLAVDTLAAELELARIESDPDRFGEAVEESPLAGERADAERFLARMGEARHGGADEVREAVREWWGR